MKIHRIILFSLLITLPLPLYASFIESTIGTAVVNDATAAYYNPAALVVLKKPQLIPLGSAAVSHTSFTGRVTQTATGFSQTGTANANTYYYLPALYAGLPINNRISLGLAVISNILNRDMEGNSILRYAQSSNSVHAFDLVPAVGVKINDRLSLGAALNFSHARFIMQPISGFPSFNIPDSQSRNDSSGSAIGGDIGLLFKVNEPTVIGLNYRTVMTYQESGKSVLSGNTELVSNHYRFKFFTPARGVFSINHFVTPTLGFIATVQRIQWSIFRNINIQGIATQIGPSERIVNATAPYYLHNAWALTLGSHYRFSPEFILRIAGSYNQSPGGNHYQVANDDSLIIGASMGYTLNQHVTIDGSYAHAFMKNADIDINSGRNLVNGVNRGSRDGVSLKLTLNV